MEDIISRNKRALEGRLPGDVVFFHPVAPNLFASVILAVTKQYYHHGAIVLDEKYVIEADPSNGVHISALEPYLSIYKLYLFRYTGQIDGNIIAETAKKYEGWKYDYGNVIWAGLGFILYNLTGLCCLRKLRNPFDNTSAVESEEYIDVVFKDCNIELRPDLPPTNVSAQDLADSKLLMKISPED